MTFSLGSAAQTGIGELQPHRPSIQKKNMKTEHHSIGPDSRIYLIAEIGLNHNGSEALAIQMIEAAARSGASCAKFQLFDSSHFIQGRASLGDGRPGSLQDFFRNFELPAESWKRLVQACQANRIDFLCSIFDSTSLDLYESLGRRPVKIASTDLVCRPLLEEVRRRRLPIYLSTGASEEAEVERTVEWIGKPELLFQCVSSYPADPAEYNLSVLPFWHRKYQCLTGISDHCMDLDISLMAPALGAVAIERHFTLDRSLDGPDQSLSSTPEQFRELSGRLGLLRRAMGDGIKKCQPSEQPVRSGGRRSLYLTRNLSAGHVLELSDLRAMRPGGGLDSSRIQEFLGRRLMQDLGQGDMLNQEHLEPG